MIQCTQHFHKLVCDSYLKFVLAVISKGKSNSYQVAVGDIQEFAFMIEGAKGIAYTIDRCAIVESMYALDSSNIVIKFTDTMVILYANILRYLAKAKHYFGESAGYGFSKASLY